MRVSIAPAHADAMESDSGNKNLRCLVMIVYLLESTLDKSILRKLLAH